MEIIGVPLPVVVVLTVAVLVGALVQGLVGLGVGLVAAPMVTLLAPELMPSSLLLVALLLPMITLLHEHRDIDWRGLGWSLPARVPGTALGVWLVASVSARGLGIVVGLMVLASVVVTYRAVRVPITPSTLVGAGFVSGVTGTATSIGGPPIAVLYQHSPATRIRATLAVYFLLGALFSLVGLGVTGAVDLRDLWFALMWLPALFLGAALARVVRRIVDPASIRLGVLAVCAASAVVLLARSLIA